MQTEKAVERVEAIVSLLLPDIKIAIGVCETMEAANDVVAHHLSDRHIEGIEAFNVVQHSLALKLAMDLARIFDVSFGRALDTQDKASIPILVHHLRKEEVAAELIQRARQWVPGWKDDRESDAEACRAAIDRMIERWDSMQSGEDFECLDRIRELRTRRLAHNLVDKDPDPLPYYSDLFTLMAQATAIGTDAQFAVLGIPSGLQERVEFKREIAEVFWRSVRAGLELEPLDAQARLTKPPLRAEDAEALRMGGDR
ncbi:MAG: hypothetical protein K2Y56_25235 [Methylobacterium sp.]|uniref:AbiU2 domain-containing protein n=1 Tax=Methylobacterium sp. TaxID=409 RepID=UPI0025D07D4A|nr:hypothetical protein [Methylobacterium sp.]MBX9934776.1 hypothetical protein [Methylobacterium sp.]